MAIKRKQSLDVDVEKKMVKRKLSQGYVEAAYVENNNKKAAMVAIKRKLDLETSVEKKRVKRKPSQEHVELDDIGKMNATTLLDDRISELPHSLRLHILSFIEPKQAVRTSVLSKQWLSSWKSIPVLEFNSGYFEKIKSFDNFVNKVLFTRDHSVKLDKLAFNREKACSKTILNSVFDYAFEHRVNELEVYISSMVRKNNVWPIVLRDNSLRSLKLQSTELFDCPFLELKSRSFKNLTVLHLRRAIINHLDSFSGFPMLEKLTLVDFDLNPDLGNTLNVHALRLSELTISSRMVINRCELTTPKLNFFEYRGRNFPLLKTHNQGGLPVLETVVIDFQGSCYYSNHQNRMFEDLIKCFSVVYNAKSLKVLSAVAELLSLFQDKLVNRCSPFLDLKCLTMDFSCFCNHNLYDIKWKFELFEALALPNVKDYFLQNSPEAKFSKIYPKSLV